MKKLVCPVLTAAALFSATLAQAAFNLDFANVNGSSIAFYGSANQFNILGNGSGQQWQITGSSSGAAGGALGLLGTFSGGPWSYGPINVVIPGVFETASVGAGGTISIFDGSVFLTGNINWIELSALNASGYINSSAAINISGISYSGSVPDLLVLKNSSVGSVNLTFQWGSSHLLSEIQNQNLNDTTSYSGTIAVPEPTTMIAGALLLLPFGASALRIFRSRKA